MVKAMIAAPNRPLGFAVAALVIAAHIPLFTTLVAQSKVNPYAGHVAIVPVLGLVLLLVDLHRFPRSADRRSSVAVALTGLALSLVFMAYRTGIVHAQVLSVIAATAVLVWSLYGLRGVRRAAFALAFMLLMVPPPREVMATVVPTLQSTAAIVTGGVLRTLQIPMQQDGVFLRLPGLQLHVAEECAGLRFLLIQLVCVAAFARVVLPTIQRQIAVIVLSIPVAILANVARVTVTSIGAYAIGPHVVTGPLHYYIGKMFWAAALGSVIVISTLLRAQPRGIVADGCRRGDPLTSVAS
jgi:exosortase